ncbi:MAG: ribonuclease III [Rhizobiales bacterium TMED83]|mgnify:FL=1|jgi:ribonuclease-3|nr:ribonuclease III [Rhodobiaceae bacterium]RPF94565.1 MAG: ribonuclease III [Rhizobiales bacterium TMED83]HCD16246.1 ribonuclease III [Rhodobiaceae bacterium]|tara:strand:- start:56 stop:733 length:678 start_codon:yes stop_codon:yes gene_type:complete
MDAGLRQFETALAYSFSDDALLHRALRHASLDVEDDNEHLEFLGDRVLGLVVAQELLARYPQETEGDLARRLAELVSRRICAEIAAEINLHAVIRCDPGQRGGGGMPARNILANGCEAVLGAIYLDGGLSAATKTILGLWGKRLDAQTDAPIDAKTELQEWAMKRKHAMPAYEVVSQSGPAHAPTFHVSVTVCDVTAEGQGASRRLAEQAAAAQCLLTLSKGGAP